MAEKWTNTSAPPPSTVMKPKPLSALNHFTVPCAMLNSPSENADPVKPGPMTVFEQRRREAAFQRTSHPDDPRHLPVSRDRPEAANHVRKNWAHCTRKAGRKAAPSANRINAGRYGKGPPLRSRDVGDPCPLALLHFGHCPVSLRT